MKQERAWLIAIRVTTWIVGALFIILLGTGLWLTFHYRPTVTDAYQNVKGLERPAWFTARRVHRVASELFLAAVGALAVSSIGLFLVRRHRPPIALALVAAGLAAVATFTGYLLPWDQLSLWAVTVGTNMEGYAPILKGHNVQYVLLGSSSVSTATFGHAFWLHTVVVPVVLIAAVVALLLRARRPRRAAAVDPPA